MGAIEKTFDCGVASAALPALGQKFVLVDAGALQMVLNALERDALEGKQARGEMRLALMQSIKSEQAAAVDAVREFIALHAKELEKNPYAYFELVHTRQTGWCAWITDHPRSMPAVPTINPGRKVLASGQGDTPEAACAAALAAQAKPGAAHG